MKWELDILKRRYYSFVALILVFVLITATGCGIRINGKDYNLFTTEKSDKVNFALGFGSESANSQKITEDRQDSEQLQIQSDSGNINIKKSQTSKIEIESEKKVRGGSDADKKKLLENMNVKLERDGKVIKVVVKTKDGKDFWNWKKDNYKTYQASINYDISVPEGINVIEADIGAGNIEVSNISSRLSLDTGAGNIDVQDVVVLNANKLNTGAGNIDFNGKFDGVSSFDASTGIGNVDFGVPEDTKFSLEADTGVGVLSGSFIKKNSSEKLHFNGDINGGGPSVKLDTGVGNVDADQN